MIINGNYVVTYWMVSGRIKSKVQKSACFSDIDCYNGITKVIFKAYVNRHLDREDVAAWLAFLQGILDPARFTYRYFPIGWKAKEPHVMFYLKPGEGNITNNLLYLTAFRYLEEFPVAVKIVSRCRQEKTGIAETFSSFCQASIDGGGEGVKGEANSWYNVDGHGLCGGAHRYGPKPVPITLEKFKSNLAAETALSVHSYFV